MCVDNIKIKEISSIYDDIAEEVRQTKRFSLPSIDRIEKGVNYTSFKNLYHFLQKFNLLESEEIKLYIRAQYEVLWRLQKYNNKVIPVNMMYNPNAMDRFTHFIRVKEDKIGKTRLAKYLEGYIHTSLVRDLNCLSLSEDIRLVLEYLFNTKKVNGIITSADVVDAVILIENGDIVSMNKESVCPAYLILNPHINIASSKIQEIFGTKLKQINNTIKNRGKSYLTKLTEKKSSIVTRLIKQYPEATRPILKDFI